MLNAFKTLKIMRIHCEKTYIHAQQGNNKNRTFVKKKILVIGYFRNHLSDDTYYETLLSLLDGCFDLTFCSINSLNEHNLEEYSIALSTGGDILNENFVDKLTSALKQCTKRPCCFAFSAGMPDPIVADRVLHVFDHIFMRSSSCYTVAVTAVGSANVTYMPDLAFAMGPAEAWDSSLPYPLGTQIVSRYKLGVCLAQPAFASAGPAFFNKMVECVFQTAKNLMCQEIRLFSFNTAENDEMESDVALNDAFASQLRLMYGSVATPTNQVLVTVESSRDIIQFRRSMSEMTSFICMRYQALVFSVLEGKAFFAVYTTKRIENLLIDLEHKCHVAHPSHHTWGAGYKLPVDSSGVPISAQLDPTFLTQQITRFFMANNRVCPYRSMAVSDMTNALTVFVSALTFKKRKLQSPPGQSRSTIIAREVTFLEDSALTECFQALPDALKVAIDMDYISQGEFQGEHRSGWDYVTNGLRLLDANLYGGACCDGRPSVLLDPYVDRTFHWGSAALEQCGKIPFVQPWAGFVHHTYDTSHSDFNCVQLFNKPLFLQSLGHCKCIFTLSNDLAAKIRASLVQVGHPEVPVRALVHPTESTTHTFSLGAFMASRPSRCVLHVGAWLRRPYAFFELNLSDLLMIDRVPLRKVFLTGPGMDAYVPHDTNYVELVKQSLTDNKFNKGLTDMLERQKESVTLIDATDFDTLLESSIVFINLVDASAVNTVIECIVRGTPVYVNRLPALQEILGEAYPGFYDTLRDAEMFMASVTHIARTHDYLKRLDKTPFKLATFLKSFHDTLCDVLC